MSDKDDAGQSGGVNIHGGTVNTGGGDITGRDKIMTSPTRGDIENALSGLRTELKCAPDSVKQSAGAKYEELKAELEKGKSHDDGKLAKLINGLVALVPSAASAIVSAFGSPILAAVAGPVTKYVIGELKGDPSQPDTIDV